VKDKKDSKPEGTVDFTYREKKSSREKMREKKKAKVGEKR